MESTWAELLITYVKEFAGANYHYLIVLIVLAPLIPFIWKNLKKFKPFFTKISKLLNISDSLELIHRDVKLFNGKITAILSFMGESLKGIAFFECDSNGHCLMITRYWSNITGLSLDDSLGFGWVSAIVDEDRERVFESWLSSVEQKREWRSEFYVVHRETRIKTRLIGISLLIRDDTGRAARFMRMFTPV